MKGCPQPHWFNGVLVEEEGCENVWGSTYSFMNFILWEWLESTLSCTGNSSLNW